MLFQHSFLPHHTLIPNALINHLHYVINAFPPELSIFCFVRTSYLIPVSISISLFHSPLPHCKALEGWGSVFMLILQCLTQLLAHEGFQRFGIMTRIGYGYVSGELKLKVKVGGKAKEIMKLNYEVGWFTDEYV